MTVVQAGWAEIDITPPLGLPMGGRGPRSTPGAVVLDPLVAQALVLQDGRGRRTLWQSLDLIGMTQAKVDPLRRELADAAQVAPEAVVLNFAHTHSGPMVNFGQHIDILPKPPALTDYINSLGERIIQLARQAADRLSAVSISWHEGSSGIAMNRRRRIESGKVEMRPNPAGTHNPDLWVLDIRAQAASGSPRTHISSGCAADRCVLFCHACHPVIVYGFAYDGISADYPGQARRVLREKLGPNVHCQFFQSFCGNVRPAILADLSAGIWRKSTPDDLTAVGRELADDVLAALALPGEPVEPDLAAATGQFQALRADPPPLEHWQSQLKHEDPFYRSLAEYWSNRYRQGPPLAKSLDFPVGLVRLDADHFIAYMGGEVVAEWLPVIRSCLGRRRLMAWGYCQQVEAYLPTDELLDEGGYEVESSNWFCMHGPGSFAPGLNAAAGQAFSRLRARLSGN